MKKIKRVLKKIKRVLRYTAAIAAVLVYVAIIAFGCGSIWKLAKQGFHIDPLKWTIGFIGVMLCMAHLYLVFVVIPILPDKEPDDEERADKE